MLCILFGSSKTPSTRHRFYVFKDELEKEYEIVIGRNLFDLLRYLTRADLIFIQKKLINAFFWTFFVPLTKAKIIYDFDDAIYTSAGKNWSSWTKLKIKCRFQLTLRLADLVLCPSNYLATEANKYSSKVVVFPMSVKDPQFNRQQKNKSTLFGWAGHPQSLDLLKAIVFEIGKFQKESGVTDFLLLCGDVDPKLDFSYTWMSFSLSNEKYFFENVDVGLAPSRNTIFDMGKSPIKIIQHFSYSKTVLTNMRGGAEDIVNANNAFIVNDVPNSWGIAMCAIINAPLELKIKSDNAYLTYQNKFDFEKNKRSFSRLLKNV